MLLAHYLGTNLQAHTRLFMATVHLIHSPTVLRPAHGHTCDVEGAQLHLQAESCGWTSPCQCLPPEGHTGTAALSDRQPVLSLQMYSQGASCDTTGGKRSTTVGYECGRGSHAEITSVHEPASCTYYITVAVPELCQHPGEQLYLCMRCVILAKAAGRSLALLPFRSSSTRAPAL